MRIWIAWLTATLGSFAVLEWLALRREKFPPLSYVLRRIWGTDPPCRRGRFTPAVFMAGSIWLTGHLVRVVNDETENKGAK